MMTAWLVYKTGAVMFDQLHACGLAVLLACLTDKPVKMADNGLTYHLQTAASPPASPPDNLWQHLFPLPTAPDLAQADPLARSVFDGLLAALFTQRGVRLISAVDAIQQARQKPETIDRGLQKVSQAIVRWQTFVSWQSRHQTNWIAALLLDYRPENPPAYHPAVNTSSGLSIPMTIDPTFSYASRHPASNRLLAQKCNLTFAQMPYAVLLAYVGAGRALRAQRTNGDGVNYYTPFFQNVEIQPDFNLPTFKSSVNGPRQTLLYQWLATYLYQRPAVAGLAYQTLQTQGAQQSISIMRGYLDCEWLRWLDGTSFRSIIRDWCSLLSMRVAESPLELDLLEEALLLPGEVATWRRHWMDQALYVIQKSTRPIYRVETIQEIVMQTKCESMSQILAGERGTIRFGRALRQLGRHNPAELQDRIDELQSIQSLEDLLSTLAQANQSCLIAKVRNEFIIVPDDDDLAFLLDDIAQFGPREIASLLIILASLSYPRKETGSEDTLPPVLESKAAVEGGTTDV
jgi:hypothetical protein